MEKNRILILLERGGWGQDKTLVEEFKLWRYYPIFWNAMEGLNEDALYKSRIHGSGHIHRVLFWAGLIAWLEDLAEEDVRQYFRVASYHDVGRTFDGLDLHHGSRSAEKLAELTGQKGEPLLELKAAVAAHSQPDDRMEEIIREYGPENFIRTVELTRLLKDADNLDRVRLGDLNPKFLRHESAKRLAEFSPRLFELDQLIKAN